MTDSNDPATDEGGDVSVVALRGNLDADRGDFFFSMLVEPINKGHKKLVIDCEQLGYVTSLGLGMLLRVHTRVCKRGGEVKLACVKPAVAEVFRVVRFDQVMHIYPTVQDAVESFESE